MMLASNPDNGQISAPVIEFPQPYNAASDLLERNLGTDRAGKIAVHDDHGSYTYAELADRVNRFANTLGKLGVCTAPEENTK